MNQNIPFIKKIPANIDGRDFIVGDLHGCYQELMNLLDYVKFDPKIDRLFSTGDLIDRGPHSKECINLLKKDWFYPVYGNHEDLLLIKMNMIDNGESEAFSAEEIKTVNSYREHVEFITKMPLFYEVEHLLYEKFFVVHAEILPEHLNQFEDTEEDQAEYKRYFELIKKYDITPAISLYLQKKNNELDNSLKQKFLWSRKIISSFYKSHKEEFEMENFDFLDEQLFSTKYKIFCGHNIVPFPMKIWQQYYIDTGASLGYSSKEINSNLFSQFGQEFFALTLVEISTGLCYGCATTGENAGKIFKLEDSLYHETIISELNI